MLSIINKTVWSIATVLIVFSSFYYTFKLKFIQIRIDKMFKYLFQNENKKGISTFKALMMTLAGRIGIGSIAGVALAIYVGGPGSVFWLLFISFFSASLSFSETVLGIRYRTKEKDVYLGGPSEYIDKGLKKKKLGRIYAFIILFSYIVGFIGIQSNTITKALTTSLTIKPYIIGIIVSTLTILIIYGGVKKIADASSKIVTIMAILYIFTAIVIVLKNINLIPNVFIEIVNNAFNFKSITGGFVAAFVTGIQRAIFSNEAGLGTGSIASSVSNTDSSVKTGYVQMLGIYITSFLVCSATAIIILTSNYKALSLTDINGIELTSYAFDYHLGNIGNIILLISILLFAFSTILTGYYYCESSMKFLIKKANQKHLNMLKILTISSVFIGCIISSTMLWNVVDILIGIIAIINIYALLKLYKDVLIEVDDAKKNKI